MRARSARTAALALAVSILPCSVRAEPPEQRPTPRIAAADGTPVTISATNPDQVIYLAKGEAASNPVIDPFENVGVAPVQIRLAPGLYTIESSGPTTSTGHAVFRVGDAPVSIEVRTGDASVKTFGAILIALGVTAVITGIIVLVSYTQNEGSYNKAVIAIPLFGGAVLAGGVGVGLTFAGATRIVVPEEPAAPAPKPAFVPSLQVRF